MVPTWGATPQTDVPLGSAVARCVYGVGLTFRLSTGNSAWWQFWLQLTASVVVRARSRLSEVASQPAYGTTSSRYERNHEGLAAWGLGFQSHRIHSDDKGVLLREGALSRPGGLVCDGNALRLSPCRLRRPQPERAPTHRPVPAVGTGADGFVAPWLFGTLIATGDRSAVAVGYAIGAALVIVAGLLAWRWGVDAERRALEDIAPPMSTHDHPARTTGA